MCCGCSQKAEEKTIFAMDTVMTLKAYGKNAAAALDEAQREIYRLDRIFDRREGEVNQLDFMSEAEVEDDVAQVIKKALEISQETDGAFDITVAPIMDAWGFYNKEYRVPDKSQIEALLEFCGYENIEINGNTLHSKNGATVDLGGIAKGYTSSRVSEIFSKHGIKSGIISLGGNVETFGKRPDNREWTVAISDPENPAEYIGTVSSQNNAVITSGDYQRFFEADGQKYHHILNPKDGYPVENGLRSVTVISSDSARADALSTALFVMGMEKGVEHWKKCNDFGAIFVSADGKISVTENIDFKSNREFTVIRKHSDL